MVNENLENSASARLQELRKALEADYGEGYTASIIVQDHKGEVVLFISGASAAEVRSALINYERSSLIR